MLWEHSSAFLSPVVCLFLLLQTIVHSVIYKEKLSLFPTALEPGKSMVKRPAFSEGLFAAREHAWENKKSEGSCSLLYWGQPSSLQQELFLTLPSPTPTSARAQHPFKGSIQVCLQFWEILTPFIFVCVIIFLFGNYISFRYWSSWELLWSLWPLGKDRRLNPIIIKRFID